MNGMKSRGAVARYLRIGEPVPEKVVPTELGPHEAGSTGGTVARYLKIERHERPAVKKTAAAPKNRRPAKVRRTTVAVELDPADMPRPVARPEPAEVRKLEVERPAPRQRPAKTTMIQCPDCDAKVPAGTDQCPSCALFLDKAA